MDLNVNLSEAEAAYVLACIGRAISGTTTGYKLMERLASSVPIHVLHEAEELYKSMNFSPKDRIADMNFAELWYTTYR